MRMSESARIIANSPGDPSTILSIWPPASSSRVPKDGDRLFRPLVLGGDVLQVPIQGLLNQSGEALFAPLCGQLEKSGPLFVTDFDSGSHEGKIRCMHVHVNVSHEWSRAG